MSIQAEQQRTAREHWAQPGGSHDHLITFLKTALPATVAIVFSALMLAPFTSNNEVSFVLDKNSVDIASERMRVREALYRGQDTLGRPFSIRTNSAVQRSSRDPFVDMQGLSARLQMKDGPATLVAKTGRYDIHNERLGIVGPVQFTANDGYTLQTRDVGVDLRSRRLESHAVVDGTMPIGTFSADQLKGDLGARTLTLNGRARLRIVQNNRKGQQQ